MNHSVLRIGTRESELAVWQASLVQKLLLQSGISSELVYIKSEGDIDTVTPLYALGVQGIFTKTLDAALLSNKIDLAVHSMKDVPTQLADGILQAAVLKRASNKDILLYKKQDDLEKIGYCGNEWKKEKSVADNIPFTIATSSIRRIAQWLHRYPHHTIENLRGNVNTRVRKLNENSWNGAIFAAAGLERIGLRPSTSVDLDWMLPAPAQGAIIVVCRENDTRALNACSSLNDPDTALCTRIERDFLKTLMGGCSTPISALAEIKNGFVAFKGNIVSTDGVSITEIEKSAPIHSTNLGVLAANELLLKGGKEMVEQIRKKEAFK
jgi:hydroxymethylbilane synthase